MPCLSSSQRAGHKYTKPMKQSGITWDNETMFSWLISPKTVVKGTNMAFAGFKKAEDRADVVAYLNTTMPGAAKKKGH